MANKTRASLMPGNIAAIFCGICEQAFALRLVNKLCGDEMEAKLAKELLI